MPKNNCENRLLSLLSSQEWHLDRLYGEYSRQFGSIFRNYNGRMTQARKKQLQQTLNRFNDDLQSTFESQINNSFTISNLCNDDFAKEYLKGMEVKDSQMNKILAHNPNATASFLARTAGGMKLSDRVWALTNQTQEALESVLESGVLNGRSAAEMATDLKKYLKEPDRRFRRIRNEQGKLILSNPAKDYHPGRGVYRSSYKNALRLSRNEINIAYRTNDFERRKNMPFVMGQRVQLSAAHPAYDICDEMVGTYPKEFKFVGWHANCLCFTTSLMLPRDKMKDYLGGGSIDNRYMIKGVPKNALDYLNNNADKLRGYSNTPYFLKDNFKFSDGKYVPMMKAAPSQMAAPSNKEFIEKPKPQPIKDIKGLEGVIADFAVSNPQMFVRGFKSMQITKKRGVNGSTDRNGNIWLTKPIMDDVTSGINNIRAGIPTTLQQETALSTLNHEIWHNASKVGYKRLTKLERSYMELSNEFVARNKMPEFMEKLGGKLQNTSLVTDRANTGYNMMVRNYQKLIELSGADKAKVVADVEKYLVNESYKTQVNGLVDALVNNSKVKITRAQARKMIKGTMQYREEDYPLFLRTFKKK